MHVHCQAHRLNLALVDSVKAVQATMQPTHGVSEQPQVVTSTRAAWKRRLPARFYDSIVMVSVGDRSVVDDKKSLRSRERAASLNVALTRLNAALCEVSRL